MNNDNQQQQQTDWGSSGQPQPQSQVQQTINIGGQTYNYTPTRCNQQSEWASTQSQPQPQQFQQYPYQPQQSNFNNTGSNTSSGGTTGGTWSNTGVNYNGTAESSISSSILRWVDNTCAKARLKGFSLGMAGLWWIPMFGCGAWALLVGLLPLVIYALTTGVIILLIHVTKIYELHFLITTMAILSYLVGMYWMGKNGRRILSKKCYFPDEKYMDEMLFGLDRAGLFSCILTLISVVFMTIGNLGTVVLNMIVR